MTPKTPSPPPLSRRTLLQAGAWTPLALSAFACAPAGPPPGTVVLNRGNGPDIKSLDPAYIEGIWEAYVVGDMLMGLTTDGPAGQPVPGAATHWQASPDGLTWTFYLREHLWSDGVAVTAADFVTGWRREVDPATAAPYAYNLWVVKNAKPITEGRMKPETLGIAAIDARTLVVTLEHPAPYLPQLMAHQVAYPIPRHRYEKLGNAWSKQQNYVGNGPYIVKEWIPLDHVSLVKNPRFYDAANVQIDIVNYYVTPDAEAALRRYRAGELDVQSGFPALEIDWIRANIPDQIKSVPYLETSYLVMNFTRKPFQDRRLREVLNLALDRETLVKKIFRLGQSPAYAIVPPGIANYPHTAHMRFQAMPFAQRLARAQDLMRQMGYGPQRRLKIDYLTSTSPDAVRGAAAMMGMYAQVWIDLNLVTEEGQVTLIDLQQHNFDLAGSGWIADFDDASNFLDLLRAGSGENYGDFRDPAYDALLDKAQREPDAQIRGQLLNEAEQMALDDYAWVPIDNSVTQELVKPYVKGWIPNAKDINRTRWLKIEGKPERR